MTAEPEMHESVVVFADALGTEDHSLDPRRSADFLVRLVEAIERSDRRLRAVERHQTGFAYRWFSDCLSMSTPITDQRSLSRALELAARLQLEFLLAGVFLRGAGTVGLHHHSQNIDFGPALTTAARLEHMEATQPRILLTRDLCERLSETSSEASRLVVVDLTDDKCFLNFFPFLDETARSAARDRISAALASSSDQIKSKFEWLADYFNYASGARRNIESQGLHRFKEYER